jgi:hypothetical protein
MRDISGISRVFGNEALGVEGRAMASRGFCDDLLSTLLGGRGPHRVGLFYPG